jgi:hypothetical protein
MYIQCLCYMFQPHRAIFRQHIFKESTALCCALGQIVLFRHVVVVINNFDDIGCFLPIFFIAAVCVPLGVQLSWLCASSVALCCV